MTAGVNTGTSRTTPDLLEQYADYKPPKSSNRQLERDFISSTVRTPVLSFYDDFERADVVGSLGIATSGQAWLPLSGAGAANGGITGGRYVGGAPSASNVVYAGVVLAAVPVRYGARFSLLAPAGGAGVPVIAIISSPDGNTGLNKMLHFITSANGWTLSWWNGVSQNNILQATSGKSVYATPLLTDGTVYECWITVQGKHVHIDLPDGTTADYFDNNVPVVSGSTIIFEHAYSNTSAYVSRYESVAAYLLTDSQSVAGPLSVPMGLQGTPIGNVSQAAGYFSSLGVNTLSPLAQIHALDGAGGLEGLRVSHSTTHAAMRVRATAAGFEARIWLDQGQTNPNKIYSAGNANDVRIMVNNTDRFIIPLSGAAPIEFLLHPIQLTTGAFAGTGSKLTLGGTDQATVGAAGAAAALPAQPLGYIIAFKGATKVAIPYYNG